MDITMSPEKAFIMQADEAFCCKMRQKVEHIHSRIGCEVCTPSLKLEWKQQVLKCNFHFWTWLFQPLLYLQCYKASLYLTCTVSFPLYQGSKINNMMEQYRMQDAKPVCTSVETQYPMFTSDDRELPDNAIYWKIMGSFLYISTVSQPDISAAVGILCRRVEHPWDCDLKSEKWVLHYLKGTVVRKLYQPLNPKPELIAYVASDWARDATGRKSTSC